MQNAPLSKSPSERELASSDEARKPLFRVVPVGPSLINPYRFAVVVRLLATLAFLGWRVSNPNFAAYGLWLVSVICEIIFAALWLLGQAPKWSPIAREIFLDRLYLRCEAPGARSKMPAVDVFVTSADVEKEPPLVTANVILSILATDYPPEKLSCYLSDDGAALAVFETMTETASFARFWLPFCKQFAIEPRAPELYFKQAKGEYLKSKVDPDFVRVRRQMKREYEEFKVRINALVAKGQEAASESIQMADGTPWPGSPRDDHVGMIQVLLQPDGETVDVEGGVLPRLVYVAREMRPGVEHHGRGGALNALLRTSALLSNAPYVLALHCDHFVNDARVIHKALCFLVDAEEESQVCYVQFPERFTGAAMALNDHPAAYHVTCKGLDGVQGPMLLGSGCCIRREALYGAPPPNNRSRPKQAEARKPQQQAASWRRRALSCCWPRKTAKKRKDSGAELALLMSKNSDSESETSEESSEGESSESEEEKSEDEVEAGKLVATKWHGKRFGVCQNFVTTTFRLHGGGGVPPQQRLLSDVIEVLSCHYEDRTEWGKAVGWLYGYMAADLVTGMVMHSRGWRSVYCLAKEAAFVKASGPANLAERLHKVLRWGLGSVEIFFSQHNPLWYNWGGGLRTPQRIAYLEATVYPFGALPVAAYCILAALCLLLDEFLVGDINDVVVVLFVFLCLVILATSMLEIRWSGVSLEEFWQNEQFWVIGGTSAHLAAVWQGVLKVLVGLESQFVFRRKEVTAERQGELYAYHYSALIVLPMVVIVMNLLGIVGGLTRAVNVGNPRWGQLICKLLLSAWVLLHLYPFAKGLMGRQKRIPTIVIVWCSLLAISLSLLWVRLL